MKQCSNCRKNGVGPKPKTEFYTHKQSKDGLGSWCKACNREAILSSPSRAESAKGYRAEQMRRWRAANPERNLETNRRQLARRLGLPEPTRPRPDNCESCGDPPSAKGLGRLSRDHDHVTGKFRGWLCTGCNLSAGCLKDDPLRVDKLAAYLRRI